MVVVVEAAPGNPLVADYLRRVEALEGVSRAEARPGTPPQVTVLDVTPEGTSEGPVATRLVEEIRALERPVAAGVTGPAAFLVDYRDSLSSRLPYALALIGLATFALLFLMTGSVVVPVKAIVMNVLSLGASFGALVWVFQDGHLSGLLGFDPPGHGRHHHPTADLRVRLRAVHGLRGVPAVADQGGLGPDRRQRPGGRPRPPAHRPDRHLGGRPDRGRVPRLRGRELLTIKMVGLGMAIAVVLDATVVRMLLVPATMKLMGRWNWWAPPAMRRFHDRYGLVEQPPQAPPRRDGTERVGSLHAGH